MQTSKIDPNFTLACAEITNILKKYNLGAMIFLASEHGTHFHNAIDIPRWSCVKFENAGDGQVAFRIRASSKNPEDHNKLELTVNMLGFFGDMMINHAGVLKDFENRLSNQIQIDRKNHIGKEPDWSPS